MNDNGTMKQVALTDFETYFESALDTLSNVTTVGTLGTLTVTGDVTVNTNVLKVDTSNNRVGIKNASPDVTLDIGSATDAIHVPVGTTAQRPSSPAAGYFRYNTTTGGFEGYTDAWGEIAGGGGTSTLSVNTYTGDGSTTAFTLSQAPASEDNLIVFIEGVYQNPNDFVLNGTTLTFDVAPANSRKIVAYHVSAAVSGNNLNHDQFTADGSTAAFTLSISPIHENNTQVFIDGVYQQKDSYAVSGTTLTLDANPANGAKVEVMTFTQTDVNTLPASFVSGLTEVTAASTDHMMIFDATDNALKKALVSDVIETVGSNPTFTTAAITNTSTGDSLTITTTEDSSTAAPVISLKRNSGSPADADYLGQIKFKGENDADQEVVYAKVTGKIQDASDGTEDGIIEFANIKAGSQTITARLKSDKLQLLNSTGLEVAGLTYPTSDGSNGQALVTDGSGNLSFSTISSGASDINGLSDAKTFGTSSIMIGDTTTGTIDAANYNTGVGVDVFAALTSGDNNTAVGFSTLTANTTGFNNTAVGYTALQDNTTGGQNVALGSRVLPDNTEGNGNVGIGEATLFVNTTGDYNVGIGLGALQNSNSDDNIAIGYRAMHNVTSASDNVAIGSDSLFTATVGTRNVGVGYHTLRLNTASDNVALGYNAMAATSSGSNNIGIGAECLDANTTGSANVAVGYRAMTTSTDAHNNTGIGQYALRNLTTGNENTCVGYGAGDTLTTGYENVCMGVEAGDDLTGYGNVIIGFQSGYNNTSGHSNVFVGRHTAYNAGTGYANTFLGQNAGYHCGNGYRNVAIGYSISIPSNTNHRYAIGYNNAGGSNTAYQSLSVHNGGSGYVRLTVGSTTVSASSDERIKKDIEDMPYGLSFIKRLRPVNYKFKLNSELPDEWNTEGVEDHDSGWQNGFIAQEVKAALDAENIPAEKVELWSEDADNHGLQSLGEASLIPMLVKSIQEQQTIIDDLKARIETLENA